MHRVKHLADGDGMVAVILKVSRQSREYYNHIFRFPLARVGTDPGQHAEAGCAAYRQVAVGALEQGALFREFVDLWRVYFIVAIGTELRSQVINGDKEHIGSLRRVNSHLARQG